MKERWFINTVCLPIRLVLSHEAVNRLGLRSVRDERYGVVMRHCRGRLLDVGCGNNQLVREYGHESAGVDVYDFGGGALVVRDTADLPFEDASFQTVSFVASLNHIPNRSAVLKEAHRLLSEGGVLLITIINPFWGTLRHKMAWWDKDQHERAMKSGETYGMSHRELVSTVTEQGFVFVKRKRFLLRINNLYVFQKA